MTAAGFVEIVLRDGEQQLGEIVSEWRELAASIETSSYFQTPDWVLAWWADQGRPRTILGLWRDHAGRLEAVAFLSELREPVRHGFPFAIPIVTNSGSGRPHSADRCGWQCEARNSGEAHVRLGGGRGKGRHMGTVTERTR